jgi:uncharacterized protein YndB with AHSA1/START domain
MIADPSLGTFVDRNTIQFELEYPHPPSAVWSAITDPAALAIWFMPMTMDLRAGGAVTLVYNDTPGIVPAQGVVTELEPGSVLEYRFEKGPWDWPESVLRFELTPLEDGSRLVFSQRIAPDTVWSVDTEGQLGGPGTIHPGACAGWQGFFEEGLARFLNGRTAPIYDDADDDVMAARTERYRQLTIELL